MIFDKIFKNSDGEYVNIFDVILGSNNEKNYIYAMAEAKAINLIAKTVAKTEILTYELNNKKIEENKGEVYWRLNIQPNHNENGTMFLYKLMLRLLTKEKALIITKRTKNEPDFLYVADDFEISNDIMTKKTFNNIQISDNEGNKISLYKTYDSNNTIYFSTKNKVLENATISFKKNLAEIVEVIQKKYKRDNVSKWILKRPGSLLPLKDLSTGEEITYEQYKEKITNGLISEEDAITMLADVFDLTNINSNKSTSLSDYKDIFKQIGDTVASRYDIPLDIFYGNKTEKSSGNDDFITFAIYPYFELLEDGINQKIVGKENYLKGEFVQFNRYIMQHKDIWELTNGIDKLTADGFSRNEINKFLRLPHIDEKWADEHNITKNYGKVKEGE